LILGFNERLEALVVDEEGGIRPFDYVDLKTSWAYLLETGEPETEEPDATGPTEPAPE